MAYRKSELAEIQLDEAIRQFLDQRNFICAATLAGAAEEIFGSLLTREGIPNALDQLHESWSNGKLPAMESKEFRKQLNLVKNQLKHAGDPAFDELEVGEADAMLLIARAAGMHPRFADAPTAELERFRNWWVDHAEALIDGLPTLDALLEPGT